MIDSMGAPPPSWISSRAAATACDRDRDLMRRTTGRTAAECMRELFGREFSADESWALVAEKEASSTANCLRRSSARSAGFRAFAARSRALRPAIGDRHRRRPPQHRIRAAAPGDDAGTARHRRRRRRPAGQARAGDLPRGGAPPRRGAAALRRVRGRAVRHRGRAPRRHGRRGGVQRAMRRTNSTGRTCWPRSTTFAARLRPRPPDHRHIDNNGDTTMLREGTAPLIRREDYTAPAYWIRAVDLSFDLDGAKTIVASKLQHRAQCRAAGAAAAPARRGPDAAARAGRRPERVVPPRSRRLARDRQPARSRDLHARDPQHLRTRTRTPSCRACTRRGSGLFTQCEAEGFRRITYFLDRPDVMAVYSVTLRADKARYPVLLANGNLVEQGDLDNGRHFAKLARPLPQAELPVRARGRASCRCAGSRSARAAARSTCSRSTSSAKTSGKTEHAMNSLIASVVWDEARFGLPLDLERFMIVAVERLQHGRDGEQGAEHLQHQVRAGQPGHRHRQRLLRYRERGRPRVLPQLDRQPHHLPRLVPALAQGRPDGLPRPGIQHGHGRQRERARRQAHRRRARSCASASSPRTPARWHIRCGPTTTSRSTTSTPRRSTRRAPRWCA